METLPEPEFDPSETTSPSVDAFYSSLVPPSSERQTFMVVVDGLDLGESKIHEIEEKIQSVVADALAQYALDVEPLDTHAFAGIGGGLAGRQFKAQGGLISRLLPD